MRRKLSCLIATICLLGSAAQAQVPPPDQAAIKDVITRQIEAFGRDDGATAFGFATPELQSMFGSPDNFMAMVRGGYQPVYRPREFVFGATDDDGELVHQEMPVIGPDGRAYVALYSMQRDEAGQWRIAGCRLIEKAVPGS